jgi:hypothetical protein
MDVGTGWSIIRLINAGKGVLAGANPIGFATSATMFVKKLVDSESAELLKNVQQREGCAHIQLIEGSPPTPSAFLYVSNHGGVAWNNATGSSFYFWHPDTTFKPLVFGWALVPSPRSVSLVRSVEEYCRSINQPKDGYGCSQCRAANARR